jgi:(1->4)-alpha-D-glucan 1-alpha-D-glucosylmutase
MYVLWKALALRQENPDLFLHGAYLPLQAVGPAQAHLCAFARVHGDQTVVAAVPRLVARLLQGDADRLPIAPEVWGETRLLLPDHLRGCRLSNRLSGEELAADSDKGRGLPAADLFRHLPVALLTHNGGPA